jgi:hypothetical protein
VTLTGDPRRAWGVFMASAIYCCPVSSASWAAILRICNAKWGADLSFGSITMASLLFAFVGPVLLRWGATRLLGWIAEPEVWHRSPWLNEKVLLAAPARRRLHAGRRLVLLHEPALDVTPEAANEGRDGAWAYRWLPRAARQAHVGRSRPGLSLRRG